MSAVQNQRIEEISNFRSNIAQSLFHVEGAPMSLEHYPMLLAIYDGKYNKLLLKTGRQISKSTTVACFMLADSIGQSHFKTYYVSPSQEQTRKFSHTRVAKIMSYSPDVRKHFLGPESIDNVFLRLLRNGSEMAFTYALDDPDRARGYSADCCHFDEIQDILYEPVVPVIEECFDKDVEVLTRAGWRAVKAVTQDDEIADVNDAGVVEWNKPTALVEKTHTGNMVCFEHVGMRIRVTENHVMWANLKGEKRHQHLSKPAFVSASTLATFKNESFRLYGAPGIPLEDPPLRRHFDGIPGAHGTNRTGTDMAYKPLARLIGWYIAEGSMKWAKRRGKSTCPRPIITQSERRYLEGIKSTLDACGLTYSIASNSKKPHVKHITINSRLLGEYLLPLGKTRDKYIPEEFFAYPELLETLLEGIYLGDASARETAHWSTWTLFTVSKRLADDVHRAWTVLGRSARVRIRQMNGAPAYEVCAYVDNFFIFYARQERVTTEAVIDEPVYCFTVKNHRPVVRGGFGQRPVVTSQCMSNSPHARSVYCGTPKTMENTIEFLWSLSSQTEWCMKCAGCGKSTFIDSQKALGLRGPECLACRKPLNVRNGRWVDMKADAPIKGFHIPQPILPANCVTSWQPGQAEYAKAEERWERLLLKKETYGESKFANEILGVSTSTGARLLTKEVLESLCGVGGEEYEMTRLPTKTSLNGITRTMAGVDWSGGGGEVKGMEGLLKSRTVLHIWGQTVDGRLKTMFYKIFPNGHPTGWIDEIVELCNAWRVQLIVGDAGEGAMANAMLREKLGIQRVTQIRYLAASKPIDWNPNTMAYHADRTTLIDNFAVFLTHKKAIYPKLTQAAPAIADILNVYEETTMAGRKVWRHAPTQPDDCLHAQLFAWIAWKILVQDLRFYV